MKKGLLIAVVALVAFAAAPALWLLLDGGGDRRAGALSPERSSAGAWSIEVDGVKAGPALSVAGCVTKAEVATQVGPDAQDNKRISSPTHEECVLKVTGLSLPLSNWVKAMLDQNQPMKNVLLSIRNADGSGVILNLPNTYMTGFAVPVLKATDSKSVTFEVTLAPENIQRSTGPVAAPLAAKEGIPMAGNFKFELDGAALGLSSFEGWDVRQKFVEEDVGVTRFPTKQLTKLELGDLEVRLNEASTKSGQKSVLDSYFESFVVQGNSDEAAEKSASLILSDALGKQIMRFDFSNVGAYSREPVAREDNARGFGFYVEKATIQSVQ